MTEPATGRAETQLRTLTGHRPEIDGLRAVAVLLVVLYHAGLGFPGGFLGVDVFFVISGYLITGLLLKDLATGNFSLGQFWLRRIRRILPASCVMLVCVLLLGCWLLLPADLVELSRSSRSYLLFSANFFFWRNTGYFDGSVDLKPLLHFWSLAVEEQFYLLYPLYLMWFPPLDRRGKGLFGGLFLLCLAAGFYGHLRHPSAAFYLLPCRAWELLLGGLLWSLPVRQAMLLRPFTSLGVGVGLVSILGSALVPAAAWSRWFPPGLIACCGAAIVILAGQAQTGLCTRLLSQRLLRGIGVISYSLYLWHWPLLSFLRHVEVELQLPVGGVWYRLGCVAVALGLAIVSWKLIEQPIRKKRWFVTDRRCVWTAAVVSIVCLAASESLIQLGGLPGRFDAQVLRYAHPHGSDARFTRSMSAADVWSSAVYACGPRESARRWLLLGDSHAMCLLGGLEPLAQQAGIRIDQATRFATAPLPGFDHLAIWRNEGAAEFVEAAMQRASQEPYECVILFAAWEGYLGWPTFAKSLERGVETLRNAGRPVVFVLPVPDQGMNVPLVLSAAVRGGRNPQEFGVSLQAREARIAPLRTSLTSLVREHLKVVDPVPALLGPEGLVRAELEGDALYGDHQHLSRKGAARVAELIFPKIQELLSK